ncbi:uncharacterized protein [Rutidosis leptorrhynchoides]|uniref:uncharacterized protein n=1 Tax=Rutidosis leptorrhynchoides TaxID=125765 RepID=UPI003A99A3A2
MNLLKLSANSTSLSVKFNGVYSFPIDFPSQLYRGFKLSTRASASRKSVKKRSRADGKVRESVSSIRIDQGSLKETRNIEAEADKDLLKNETQSSVDVPSRGMVLQACTVTSGLIAALGLIIRQGSHIASSEGLPIFDCSAEVSFGFETWHLGLITGLVILISSSRYMLLKMWPEFSESSEAANRQVLSSLQPLDYAVVAFLPGISEEFLFHGALLPLFGMNWVNMLFVAGIFGVLHLGSGRKVSFAVWATFVGFMYGYATIASSSMIVPIASHSLNNLIGGILWRYTSSTDENSMPS